MFLLKIDVQEFFHDGLCDKLSRNFVSLLLPKLFCQLQTSSCMSTEYLTRQHETQNYETVGKKQKENISLFLYMNVVYVHIIYTSATSHQYTNISLF